ncbi:hypothetical protein [Lederbergia lenta]|uniref:hypothetical protein n=1 Tax=Lederbergia lenta TaxID=1467 RepID=UPI00203C1166|nr:hypothetical protein [Lederbergia lenta]MCM3113616.1 hypothetical protein [Lederbergia lenta]
MNKRAVDNANIDIDFIIKQLKNGESHMAEQLTKKLASNLSNDYKDPFWSKSIATLISSVILALAEDVLSSKEEKINIQSVINFFESKRIDKKPDLYSIDIFFKLRKESSLAKSTYKNLFMMGDYTKTTIFNEAQMCLYMKYGQ